MKKSLIIIILLVAGISTALAYPLYHSMTQSNSARYITASCQDYQASVRIGGVVKITSGKACQLADGSWTVYPTGQRTLNSSAYHGLSAKYGADCKRGKAHSNGTYNRKYQKWLHDIHGWNNQGKPQRFQHPQIKPGQKYHKKLQKQQPLLVQY